jgi:transketolase
MIMDKDYLMMYRDNGTSLKKATAAFEVFGAQLRELFSSDSNVSGEIDNKILINSLTFKMAKVTNLKERMSLLYTVKDSPEKIRLLIRAQKEYKVLFGNYPTVVECKTNKEEKAMSMPEYKEHGELQADQIKEVLAPINSEITRLEYKIKERLPKKDTESESGKDDIILESHIDTIEAVEPEKGYFDRRMKVSNLADRYKKAVAKWNKTKNMQ